MFGGRAKDKHLFAVFCIGTTFVWFVVYKGLHPNWNEWRFVVVLVAMDVRIRQISWDGVVIVGGEEVAILPAGEVGTRGA